MIERQFTTSGPGIVVEIGGDRFGDFASQAEAEAWRRAADAPGATLVDFRDLHTGRVTAGSAALLLPDGRGGWTPTPAVARGLDYGKLVVEAEGVPRRSLPRHAVAVARGAVDHGFHRQDEDRRNEAHGGLNHPHSVDVKPRDVIEGSRTRCKAGPGELLLVADWLPSGETWDHHEYSGERPRWLLVWRRDSRSRRDLWVLSAHSDAKCAVFELRLRAETYRHFLEPRQTRHPDVQKRRVYAWEDPFIRKGRWAERIPVEECQAVVDAVWERLALPGRPPTVHHKPWLERTSKYKGGRNAIWLAGWALTRPVVLHEAAHAVVSALGLRPGVDVAAHGPEFVAAAMALYEGFGGVDRAALEAAARAAGVRYGAPTPEFAAVLARAVRGGPAAARPGAERGDAPGDGPAGPRT